MSFNGFDKVRRIKRGESRKILEKDSCFVNEKRTKKYQNGIESVYRFYYNDFIQGH